LITYGACKGEREDGCGGIILDSNGNWLGVGFAKISVVVVLLWPNCGLKYVEQGS
jgi:hypothetical protein